MRSKHLELGTESNQILEHSQDEWYRYFGSHPVSEQYKAYRLQ